MLQTAVTVLATEPPLGGALMCYILLRTPTAANHQHDTVIVGELLFATTESPMTYLEVEES